MEPRPTDVAALEGLSALAYSRFARSLVEADPSLEAELGPAAAAPWTREAMESFLSERAPLEEQGLASALRRLRARVILRTMARDLGGRAGLAEVCATMTVLAEVALGCAQSFLEPRLAAEWGRPQGGPGQSLIVVGMGKLGGGELNVSSDIDLVFVYPEEGETAGGTRSSSNHEFHVRLGRRLIGMLAEPTADGRVFRVDMRLRPWGDPGALALGFDALENYFITQGREWERYAWIKARALTGENHAALQSIVRPFVYRKYLDYGAFGAMRELHAEVRAEVARRDYADHVKLGPGGIREIEFIAQAYQLIRGGREAALRERPTLRILELLARQRLIEEQAMRELASAYVFLRRLEHRLQYLDDAQTHNLPEDREDRARVAMAMGVQDWTEFRTGLDAHRERVTAQFERIFSTAEAPRHALGALWTDPREHASSAALAHLGYRDPDSVSARLAALRSSSRYAELPQASRARFDALVPRLVEESARHPDAGQTLERCLALMEAVSRRAAYLALLDEHPRALARVADLLTASSWASQYLLRHPILLDELLDARLLEPGSDWNAFARALRQQLLDAQDDTERSMDRVREAHHAQLFRLLVQDLAGVLTVERLADELSELADVMLQVTLELCWSEQRKQLRARGSEFAPQFPGFAVIGYGKLGGKELGYASDLDIIFLYDDPHEQAFEVYARLAQRINLWLTTRTAAGVLFDTDLRLRPDGSSGLMVSCVDAFIRYHRESAWTWEHQALTRARFCAGDARTGALFETERRHILCLERDAGALRKDVLEMRAKLLEGHPNTSELFDLKHDRGGMIDIEFIVQYLVLANAHRHPRLTANDGNIALLGMAASLGLIPPESAQAVRDAYRDYRRRQHALRLNEARFARAPAEEFAAQIAATQRLWRTVFGAD
ncbi:MAG: bifunctional [glutamate--ammonia ligase]-adenylyl-L-tyrosine phosphorylase/[glutamate--ammonia-ligase] adenylyltransferase [Burkholderiales bacterium]|nr:bifunctional [glutamate--ammonia ligase]-adenylyl-L-tyrosine phosphorylase/[glutamate--ammonia-ligase] adenylyltransferase [Burkholderiales bacterium]